MYIMATCLTTDKGEANHALARDNNYYVRSFQDMLKEEVGMQKTLKSDYFQAVFSLNKSSKYFLTKQDSLQIN